MAKIYKITVAPGLSYECTADNDDNFKKGDEVVIQFDRGQDNGVISTVGTEKKMAGEAEKTEETGLKYNRASSDGNQRTAQQSSRQHRPKRRTGSKSNKRCAAVRTGTILRRLTLRDKGKAHEKKTREASIHRTAVRKVKEHNLDMKILNCHYTFDRGMVFIQFAAEDRVDFRELVKDLSGALRARVELRQVGVRDEASLVGGIGCCGRSLCCSTVLSRFPAVNVKAVKEQNLSLNPNSVSGNCGRLKCCLRYELEGYREMNRSLPRINSRCRTEEGEGKVLDCNALTGRVRVKLDDEEGRCVDLPADQVENKDSKYTERKTDE